MSTTNSFCIEPSFSLAVKNTTLFNGTAEAAYFAGPNVNNIGTISILGNYKITQLETKKRGDDCDDVTITVSFVDPVPTTYTYITGVSCLHGSATMSISHDTNCHDKCDSLGLIVDSYTFNNENSELTIIYKGKLNKDIHLHHSDSAFSFGAQYIVNYNLPI
jgi:hypothetical protein